MLGFTLLIILVLGILSMIAFFKHKKLQALLRRWSGGEYVERNSRFNKLVFHGVGLFLVWWLFIAIADGALDGTSLSGGEKAAIYLFVVAASSWLYHFIIKRYRNKSGASGKTVALEIAYGVFAFFGMIALGFFYQVIGLVFAYMLWLKYPKLRAWVARQAEGYYEVPEKRYGAIMLHGLGVMLSAVIGVAVGFIVSLPITALFPLPPGVIAAPVAISGVPVGVYCYYLLVLRQRSKAGVAPMQVQWEIVWGTGLLCGWILGAVALAGAIALAIYAVMILLVVLVLGLFISIMYFFCFAEERTVSTGGLFSHKKKVWVVKDGLSNTYTDAAGNKYKERK